MAVFLRKAIQHETYLFTIIISDDVVINFGMEKNNR